MKKVIYFIVLMFSLVLMSTSCDKDETPEGARLRIKKIADNIAMENPTTFEYNSKGLLVKIDETKYKYYKSIEYNSNNLPIKISTYYEAGDRTKVIYIEWIGNQFITTYNDYIEDKDIYSLNSDNQIVSRISLHRENSQSEFDTVSIYSYSWSKSLFKRICTYYPPWSEENRNWEDNCTFGTGYSAYKGINMAVIVKANLGLDDWDYFQNSFSTIGHSDDDGHVVTISYDYNEQNFPIRADIKRKYPSRTYQDYVYFEYESY